MIYEISGLKQCLLQKSLVDCYFTGQNSIFQLLQLQGRLEEGAFSLSAVELAKEGRETSNGQPENKPPFAQGSPTSTP